MKTAKKSAKTKPKLKAVPTDAVREMPATEYGVARQIGAFEAKTHLASILDKGARGQKFVVTKHGRPVAQIVPAPTHKNRHVPGLWRGRIWVADDFDVPLEDFKESME